MENQNHITVISKNYVEEFKEHTVLKLNSVIELFPFFSDPNFRTDLVLIHLDELIQSEESEVFDVVNALFTLIRSTRCRTDQGKFSPRETTVAGIADRNTQASTIKDFLLINKQIKGIYPGGADFSKEEKKQSTKRNTGII